MARPRPPQPPRLLSLADARACERAVAGGKAAALAQLLAQGFAVPEGLVLPAGTRLDPRATDELWRETAALRAGEASLEVRSSARVEDGSERSLAGRFVTVLGVKDATALAAAVRAVRESYANKGGEGGESAAVDEPVLIQRQVGAEWAGVCFTADPASGIEQLSVFEAVPGLGEALVSGRVAPVYLRWDRRGRRVVVARGMVLETPQGREMLERLREVVELGERVCAACGTPQDLEWAWDGARLWLLQARPVTTPTFALPERKPLTEPEVWFHGNFAETMPGPVPRLAWDVVEQYLLRSVPPFSVGSLAHAAHADLVECLAGRVCWNVSILVYLGGLRRGSLRAFGLIDARMAEAVERLWADEGIRRVRSSTARDLARIARTYAPFAFQAARRAGRGWWVGREQTLRSVTADMDELLARTSPEESEGIEPRQAWPCARALMEGFVPTLRPHLGLMALPVASLGWAACAARWSGWELQEVAAACLDAEPSWARRMDEALRALGETLRAEGLAAPVPPAELPPRAREALAAFLTAFGFRGPREQDLSAPRFAEQPELVLELALRAAEGPAARSGEDGTEKLLAAVAARGVLGRFRAALLRLGLRTAREWAPLREDGKYVLWMPVFARLRKLVLRAGEDLRARGVLEHAEDIFHFTCAELDVLCGSAAGQGRAGEGEPTSGAQFIADARARVAARKRELERWRALDFPDVLRSDGVPVSFRPQGEAGLWRGVGVSVGVHEGRARVARTFEEARGLAAGEVLVVSAIDPGWTPLFGRAGALVMEVGGVLSHACVIARELRLPAVAGVHGATRAFHTGQRLRVDGRAGEVRVLEG
jgi:phosphohistidine swiveling domain-containing protein